jgi:hypothetical protein
MYRLRVLKSVTFLSVAALCGLSWLPHASTRVAAATPFARAATLIQDPHATAGGDMGQDNVYGFSNFVCTDGLALSIDYQSAGDTAAGAPQGHSLELRSIQDYGASSNTDPNATSNNLTISKGTTLLSDGTTSDVTVASPDWTFASAHDNSAGIWQGNTYIAHYAPVSVGDEVVGTIVRRDHGFVLNEDDDRPGGPTATDHLNVNGDDSFIQDGIISTNPGAYDGWLSADDNPQNGSVTSFDTPPLPANVDGDWAANTDGSSFDDIIRTDQVPPTYDSTNPNASPSYLVVPNPSTSKVEDCVVEKQGPTTAVQFCTTGTSGCPTTPTPDGNSGWYKHTIDVFAAQHLLYYLAASASTNYTYTAKGSTGSTTGTVPSAGLSLVDGEYTGLQFSSVDNFGDTGVPTSTYTVLIDSTPPVVTCPTPPTFAIGQSPAVVTASASDATSGISDDSPSASVNTSQPGGFSASITGQDIAGNPTTVSCPYTVQYGTSLLYKAPMSAKSGSTIPIKLELVNASKANLSSASIALNALCVVPVGSKDCTSAVGSNAGPFTFLTSLAPGGGYQFNVKTTGLPLGTYQLLFRATGESTTTTFHADAGATFTITK